MQAFELLLRFPQMARVGNGVALCIRQKCLEAQINAGLLSRWSMLDAPRGIHHELTRIAISTANETNPFDLFGWEGFDLPCAHKPQPPDAAAISEREVSAIWLKLPAGLLVLDAAAIVLKRWIAFFPWLVMAAVLIEAGDRSPCSICGGLSGL